MATVGQVDLGFAHLVADAQLHLHHWPLGDIRPTLRIRIVVRVDGFFFALDANTGEERWHINLGSRVHAGPMSYMVDGRQYVAIAAGNVLFTFAVRE